MTADARTITLALNGRWHRHHGHARCPAHGDRRPSLSLADAPNGQLLLYCHAGCDFPAVLDALRSRGLVAGEARCAPPSAHELAQLSAATEQDAARREAQARAVWTASQPLAGTPAETYLRGRGITCALPDTLRFHPECWHLTAKRLPALVALVEGGNGFAVHRTYLAPNGGMTAVEPAKAMLGAVAGRAVRLAVAPAGQPAPLVLAEGIETTLSLASGLLRGPAHVWAALSTSGLRGLILPSAPGRLTVAADGDAAGRAAAHALATRAHALGWSVSLLPAPEGQDWNDVLTAEAVP